jgi:hypothetical protein
MILYKFKAIPASANAAPIKKNIKNRKATKACDDNSIKKYAFIPVIQKYVVLKERFGSDSLFKALIFFSSGIFAWYCFYRPNRIAGHKKGAGPGESGAFQVHAAT